MTGTFRFTIKERIGDPGVDHLIYGNTLPVSKDSRERLHMVFVRMGNKPQIDMIPDCSQMPAQFFYVGGKSSIYHNHLTAASPEKIRLPYCICS